MKNRVEELLSQKEQLYAEIKAFNMLAKAYGIEPLALAEDEGYKECTFDYMVDCIAYLETLGFKKIGSYTYMKGTDLARIGLTGRNWKVTFQ